MKKRRDLRLLGVALLLLAIAFALQFFFSRREVERREKTLAGVPDFPQRGVVPRARPVLHHAELPPPKPLQQPQTRQQQDRMISFIQHQPTAAVVHLNALFNTPLYDRIAQCLPNDFLMNRGMEELGIDPTRDIDQVAFTGDGVAISGFFQGKDLGSRLMPNATRSDYAGAAIYDSGSSCVAQMGNLLVTGRTGTCPSLVDRASQPTSEGAQDDVYGDIFMHSTLDSLRVSDAPDAVQPLMQMLSGMTLRANVWDSVAVSLEGQPVAGKSANQLADIARGAMSFAKQQVDDDEVELKTLADLAKVSTSGGKLAVDLALPADLLFNLLHFPCPGADGGN